MKRTTHAPIRALALLLAVMLMLTAAPLTAFAQTSDEDQAATPAAENVTQATSTQADTTATAMPPATLTAADIPEMLSATVLAQRGTVRRVYEEETDASTLLFENNDGTRTMYLFGAPVKYIAPNGTTRDKSTAIATLSNLQPLWSGTALTPAQTTALAQNASIGKLDLDAAADALTLMSTRLGAAYGNELTLSDIAYATLDSDIRTLYPTIVTDGIVLNYGDYSIRTIPITTGNLTLPGMASVAETDSLADAETRTRVRYNSVFGTGTVLQYTPTNMGVKEEIILTRNVGKNEFPFLLETGGLTIVQQNSSYVFLDPTTQNVIATLGEVIVYDSNGAITRGEMAVQTIREGLQYGVTLTVSEEFLANAAYPVSVDPMVDVLNSGAIEAGAIYSTESAAYYTSTSSYAYGTNHAGSETFLGRVYFRIPAFYSPSSVIGNLTSDRITNLTLVFDNAASTQGSFKANPAMINWSAGTTYGDFSYSSFADTTITYYGSIRDNDICFDITALAKHWCNSENEVSTYAYGNPRYGVLTTLLDETGSCAISASSLKAEIDYAYANDVGDFYINSYNTRTFLGGASGGSLTMRSGLVSSIGSDITWTRRYAGGGSSYYLHPNGNTNLYLTSSGTIGTSADTWRFISAGSAGLYNIQAANGSYLGVSSGGSISVGNSMSGAEIAWRTVRPSEYTEVSSITFSGNKISANVLEMMPDSQADVTLSVPSGATWYSAEDYYVVVSPSSAELYTSAFNGTTFTVRSNFHETATITIRNKASGVSASLPVTVFTCSGSGEDDFTDHLYEQEFTGEYICILCGQELSLETYVAQRRAVYEQTNDDAYILYTHNYGEQTPQNSIEAAAIEAGYALLERLIANGDTSEQGCFIYSFAPNNLYGEYPNRYFRSGINGDTSISVDCYGGTYPSRDPEHLIYQATVHIHPAGCSYPYGFSGEDVTKNNQDENSDIHYVVSQGNNSANNSSLYALYIYDPTFEDDIWGREVYLYEGIYVPQN